MQTVRETGIETKVCGDCVHLCTASGRCFAPEREDGYPFVSETSPACQWHRTGDDYVEELLNSLEEEF